MNTHMQMKAAVITGGTGELGKTLALALLNDGYRVALNSRSLPERIKELAEYEKRGLLTHFQADVRSFDNMAHMAILIKEKLQAIDVLLNNAGVTRDSLLIQQKDADWDTVIETNVKGAFNAIRAFAPIMKRQSHIVNISSYAGLKGNAGQAAYSASKAALIGFTMTAAREFASRKIMVNAVIPGYMPAGMGLHSPKGMEKARSESLLSCLSAPDEVARFILYLISTKKITGQVFCLESRII